MKNYISELKKVKWPTQKNVLESFIVVIVGIVLLLILFVISDQIITTLLDKLY